jgi:hypothetical protein
VVAAKSDFLLTRQSKFISKKEYNRLKAGDSLSRHFGYIGLLCSQDPEVNEAILCFAYLVAVQPSSSFVVKASPSVVESAATRPQGLKLMQAY